MITRRLAALTGVAGLALVMSAPAAQANTGTGEAGRAAGRVAAPTCYEPIQKGRHVGHRLCDHHYFNFYHRFRQVDEFFIIGKDGAVWHIWERSTDDPEWSGWRSLGGRASDDPRVKNKGVWKVNETPTIGVIGTDFRWWCRSWPWSQPWHRCEGPR